MTKMPTKESGYFIIGSALVILGHDNGVVYPDTGVVQVFASEAKATDAHKLQFPEQYLGAACPINSEYAQSEKAGTI